MAALITSNGFSAQDITQMQNAFAAVQEKLSTQQVRICQVLSTFLAETCNWKPYKYIVIEQVNFEDDFATNGTAAQAIWKFNGKFYSVVWFVGLFLSVS